ncbi:MAG: peptidoglycan DD-metalloendopeptidase family protein [Patescibacteria group bacterium]
MSKKALIILIMLLITLAWRPSFVISENAGGNNAEIDALNQKINEKKEKVKQLEKSIEEYKAKISQKRLEAVSLSNQLAILDNRTAQVELDIEITENKLDTLSLEIETLDLNIADKETTIKRQKAIIAELLQTLHQSERKNYLEIFVAYNSFSDFYNRLQYLQTVERDLGKNAKGLRIAKEDLEDKKMQKEKIKISFEELNDKLNQKKEDMEEQIKLKADLLGQTQASELKFRTLVSTLRSQYAAIENEISGIEQEVRRRLEEQDRLSQTEGFDPGTLSWPTQSRYVTSGFRDPDYPFRYIFEHNAIDTRAAQGTPIKAAASGYVARTKRCTSSSCYSYIMLIHSGGLSTVYGHLSKITVSEDQFVTRGDVIGLSGGTPGTVGAGPFVTGPHLHFEVRKNGIPENPLGYLVKDY